MAYKTRAGDLREQITLRAPTGAVDADYGGETGAFVDVATVWAKPVTRTGRERIEGRALNAVNTITFMIRYRPGVSAAMVAVYRGTTYKILTVTETDYREFVAIDCEARDVSTN